MTGWKVLIAIILCTCLLWAGVPFSARAQLRPMQDGELSRIEAEGGISIIISNYSLDLRMDGVSYTDTDTGDSVQFNNIKIHGKGGGPVVFNECECWQDKKTKEWECYDPPQPITIDFMTMEDYPNNPTILAIANPEWRQELTFEVENFVFCDLDLGVLETGNIDMPSSYLHLTFQGGLGYEFGLELELEESKYVYNTARDTLKFKEIRLAEIAAGAPEDPKQWEFSGMFRFGNLLEDNGAQLDVVTIPDRPDTIEDDPDTTHMIYSVPMQGSMRIKDVDFGAENFGPCAIDGIKAHRLSIQIPAI